MNHLKNGAAAAVLLALPGAAMAGDYNFSNWLPPTHVLTQGIHVQWAESVKEASNGEITFEVFVGGSLLPALGTMQGVADGVAQAGHVVAGYHPSEMPLANVLGELGNKTPDPFVMSYAFLDFIMNEPDAGGEWQKLGLVPSATVSTENYYYLCKGIYRNLADLQGKRVRAFAGGWARFSESIGMIPVSIPASEIYASMERGAVDCVTADLTQLTSGSQILELTDSVIMLPLSPAYNASHITYDADFWKSLTNDQRRLLLDQTATAMARTNILYKQAATDALDAAKTAGVEIVEPSADLVAAYAAWIDDGIGGVVELARNQFKVEDPKSLLDRGQIYVDRWVGLMEGVDRSNVDAVAAVIKANLFDKIDVATYGMN